ncbi:MAG: hypothetical protein AMJ75_01125 [Phycisphaerae bacterium SM1_79]|nr:MAG: hypothetical protein AMJ75_01125 [Phycisphaerae bacterium SM1_79]
MEGIRRSLSLIVAVNSLLVIRSACAASEMVSPKADTKLQQVALFKNGLGFFVSEVTCPDEEGSFSFVPVAAASHGTFWVSYPANVKVESLAAKQIQLEECAEAVTIPELLKSNVGRKVRLCLTGEEKAVIEGVIKYLAEDRERPAPDPYAPGTTRYSDVYYDRRFFQSYLVMIETDEAEVGINPSNVRSVALLGPEPKKTFIRKAKSMQLNVQLAAPAPGEKLTVSYLAKGTTWAPSYMVDINDSKKAQISAKAAVINEVCDLDGAEIRLVTGFPHLQFADVVSPLALKEDLAQFLQALVKGESERGTLGRRASVVAQQRVGGYGGYGGYEGLVMPEYGAAEAGKVAEDLFLYPVENAQLKRGEVGYYPLFTESVPYKHIYQWKIPDYVTEEERYAYEGRRGEEREPEEEEVWHCLRLTNTTKVPWTTAPAETVKEGQILGQDTLSYTPVRGETTLRITQAVSVKGEQLELETERKRDAAQLYGRHYDLITVEGKLSVSNFQNKSITLEITKTLSGEVKSSQPKAKIETLARGLRRMNAVRELTWTVELEPGEQKSLSYVYEVYVRR